MPGSAQRLSGSKNQTSAETRKISANSDIGQTPAKVRQNKIKIPKPTRIMAFSRLLGTLEIAFYLHPEYEKGNNNQDDDPEAGKGVADRQQKGDPEQRP
jgi:hypothetical protein